MKISEYSRKNTYIYYINKRIILHKKTISRSTNSRNSHVFIYILHILTLIPLSYFLYDLCIDCAHPRYTCLAIDACAFSALMSTGLRKVKYEDWTTHDSLHLCFWQQFRMVSNKFNRIIVSTSKVAICGCSASIPRFDHNSL